MNRITRTFLFLISTVIFISGCAYNPKPATYATEISEAKNITSAGGLFLGIKDRPAPLSESPYSPGTSFGDLLAIANVAAGALEGGVMGLNNVGSAAFNTAHGIWATSDDDHWSTNYFYGYIPKDINSDLDSPAKVRYYVAKELVVSSMEILKNQGFSISELKINEKRYDSPVQRWMMESDEYGCSYAKRNCVLTIYIVNEREILTKTNPDFLGDKRSVESWKVSRGPIDGKSSIDITSFSTKKPLPELEFYSQVSSAMPNWFNLYVAPARASSPDYKQGVVPYNFIVNDGRLLKFIDPQTM